MLSCDVDIHIMHYVEIQRKELRSGLRLSHDVATIKMSTRG